MIIILFMFFNIKNILNRKKKVKKDNGKEKSINL